jgi:hypothetical protein
MHSGAKIHFFFENNVTVGDEKHDVIDPFSEEQFLKGRELTPWSHGSSLALNQN